MQWGGPGTIVMDRGRGAVPGDGVLRRRLRVPGGLATPAPGPRGEACAFTGALPTCMMNHGSPG